jgi:hypothetical protein
VGATRRGLHDGLITASVERRTAADVASLEFIQGELGVLRKGQIWRTAALRTPLEPKLRLCPLN